MKNEIATQNRSLINLCLDLIELDPDAPENKEIILKRLGELGTKVDAYVALDRYAESQLDLLNKEIETLNAFKKNYLKLQDSLRDRALFALQATGKKDLKSENGHKMSIRISESIEIRDISELPDWAIETKIEKVAKKTQIKVAIKEGEEVPGACLKKKEYIVFK